MMLAAINFEQLLQDYPHWVYLILFIGTFLEGETILIIVGGLAALEPDKIDVRLAVLAAFLGSMSGDQLYFLVGRYRGDWLLRKMPRKRPGIEKALAALERHANWLLLTFRFFYGFRNVFTFAVGMSRIRAVRFASLNAVGALIWAMTFGYGGYYASQWLLRFVEGSKYWVLGGLCAVFFALWLVRLVRRRRKTATAESMPQRLAKPVPVATETAPSLLDAD